MKQSKIIRMNEQKQREPSVSLREMARRYAAVCRYYANQPKGQIDCYTCQPCKAVMKSVQVDPGVTPMLIRCILCGELAHASCGVDIAPGVDPVIEFFRPKLSDLNKYRRNRDVIDHYLNGGLEPRIIYSDEIT